MRKSLKIVGWAVLDDTLLAHGVWNLKEAAVDWPPEAWLAAQAHRQILRSRVTLLALEVFHWRRTQPVIPEAGLIQQRVGALFARITNARDILSGVPDRVERLTADDILKGPRVDNDKPGIRTYGQLEALAVALIRHDVRREIGNVAGLVGALKDAQAAVEQLAAHVEKRKRIRGGPSSAVPVIRPEDASRLRAGRPSYQLKADTADTGYEDLG